MAQMLDTVYEAMRRLQELDARTASVRSVLEDTCTAFGEDPASFEEEQFFTYVANFCSSFQSCVAQQQQQEEKEAAVARRLAKRSASFSVKTEPSPPTSPVRTRRNTALEPSLPSFSSNKQCSALHTLIGSSASECEFVELKILSSFL
eukprot:NODE_2520_length_912_cov_56.179606_g2070_i0.p1 GENE.NODE_2520_length_912_cov_56.179606_g2070_i0~~NODE_2520_length_912_cov_56.179606_g2070_i0.p1  ORF type:complete len:148 (-),score=34.57 NODE_2520_length_912_cov_56.179606_g2070_i0:47-490(-)